MFYDFLKKFLFKKKEPTKKAFDFKKELDRILIENEPILKRLKESEEQDKIKCKCKTKKTKENKK